MNGQSAKKQELGSIKLTSNGPYNKTSREFELNLNAMPKGRKFEVRCHAEDAGHLEVAGDAVSVRIGQRIRREGKEEFWGSLLVECKEQDDGSLAVEVLVFHPDWDEPVKIASIQSNPAESDGRKPTLYCVISERKDL